MQRTRVPGTIAVLVGALVSSASPGAAQSGPSATPAAAEPPPLTLDAFLIHSEGRLLELREVELRQRESRQRVNHIKLSRAFELEVTGEYEGEDFDRLEINGANRKTGRFREHQRRLDVSVTSSLLGRSLNDRMDIALEEQRQVELDFEGEQVRRDAIADLVDVYFEVYEAQESQRLYARAIEKEEERLRILRARSASGESLGRAVLAAEADLAERRLALVRARGDEAQSLGEIGELLVELDELVGGRSVAGFAAQPLDWDRLVQALREALAAGMPPGDAGSDDDLSAPRPVGAGGLWYTIPEIDLTLGYVVESRDRTFADEKRRERGHSPEVRLSFEMPLDFYRATRAFQRQLRARQERRELDILLLRRQALAARRTLVLDIDEALHRLAVAEAEMALRDEDVRITRLRAADGEVAGDDGAAVELLEAELNALEARFELARARGDVARHLFAYEIGRGTGAVELARRLLP
ncbi:MAG: TolC family protein [Candidatus Eiseniibacteriota bacterium]|jgi:outer membrane protein TolC